MKGAAADGWRQTGNPALSHEPSGRMVAFTPLQLRIAQGLFTLKRRERRVPVQGFDERVVRGNLLINRKMVERNTFP